MKKILLSIILLFLLINMYSQSISKIRLGIKVGTAFANTNIAYTNNTYPSKLQTKAGLIAGFLLDISLSKSVTFQPALLYVRKGAQYTLGSRFTYAYAEIPLNLLYKNQLKKGIFFWGGGVSPAIKLNNYLYGTEIKSFDLGLNILTGYLFPIGFSINMGYTYGILNVSNMKESISKIQNRYFSLTAGYNF